LHSAIKSVDTKALSGILERNDNGGHHSCKTGMQYTIFNSSVDMSTKSNSGLGAKSTWNTADDHIMECVLWPIAGHMD